MTAKLEFFFDFSSPFAYLAASQVVGLANRTGAQLVLRPLLLGGLFRELGTEDAPILGMTELKRQATLVDLGRWARWWGLPLQWPAAFPLRTVLPLRVFLGSPTADRMNHIFAAAWGRGEDIARPEVLAAIGVTGAELAAAADQRGPLLAATDYARDSGVFGVPAFRLNEGALFWGQDRLDMVERACRGERVE